MQHSTSARTGTWREDLAAVLAALPHGTWTTVSALAALTDQPVHTVTEFLGTASPTGYERVLAATGSLRQSTAATGLSRAELIGQLECVGVHIDKQGRADRARRLDERALAALLADPATGVLPDGTRREWPRRAAACNTAPADRERLLALAGAVRWRDIATNLDLVHRAGLPQAIEHAPSRLFASVTVSVRTPTWPAQALVDAGLLSPSETAGRAAVHLIGLRSLEADSVVEVYNLIGPAGAVPVLVQTRPVPTAAEDSEYRTPCRRGRHDQCRGFYDQSRDWNRCPCQCGCTASGRATTARYLRRGDDFDMSSIRRSIVRASPTPDEPGRVRMRTRDWFNGAESEIGYGQDWIASVHNPRRRSKPGT